MTHRDILISSAGRRVQLVRFFQEALSRLKLDGRVIVTDMNPEWAAAAHVADAAHRAPPVTDDDFRPFLQDLVTRESIGMVVPTLDTELLRISRLRDALADLGCSAVVSDASLIATWTDKRRSAEWFAGLGFQTPELFPRERLRFPCFVKPYDGSLSRGAQAILSERMLSPGVLDDEKMMFMEYFDPRDFDEFTVDAYYSDQGSLKCLVPRKRVEIRGGEISKGLALKGKTYEYLHDKLGTIKGGRGCLSLQFFVSKSEDRCVASELNPRFGGGYPLTYFAGADYPEWLVREYLLDQELPFYSGWNHGTGMVRYDSEITFPTAGA